MSRRERREPRGIERERESFFFRSDGSQPARTPLKAAATTTRPFRTASSRGPRRRQTAQVLPPPLLFSTLTRNKKQTTTTKPNRPKNRIKSGLKGAGLSVLLGYAAAALIKTVGKTVTLLLVAAYALSAYLTKKNFLRVDWEGMLKKAGSKAAWLLDVDRDGSIGVKDLKAAVNRASGLVGKTKLSSGAAFIAGLAWGLGVLPLPV